MATQLSAAEFIERTDTLSFFDVRSPLEFSRGHITGALSLPLFEDMERAEVGTIYHQKGREDAIQKGMEFVTPRLNHYIDFVKKNTSNPKIMIYCWRGGMRSASLAEWLESNGFTVFLLEGGYKAYRNLLFKSFSSPARFIIIGGMTGSGKTEMLSLLSERGEQVIDLEAIANHKGSAFGHIGLDSQPSNQQFENDLYDHWRKLDLNQPIWLEDESITIGNVFIPDAIWHQMESCPVVTVEIPFQTRVERLVRDYTGTDKSLLAESFCKIERRIGSDNLTIALDALNNNDFFTATSIALKYYDKAYKHSLSKRKSEVISIMNPGTSSANKLAESLIELKNIHYP